MPAATSCWLDYFDFVGGTSTGAIIGSGLALGSDGGHTEGPLPPRLGHEVFQPRRFLPHARPGSKYPGQPLRDQLEAEFGQRTFGDPDLRSLLLIVTHNRTTNSPYPLANHPTAKFNTGETPHPAQPRAAAGRPALGQHGGPGVLPGRGARLRRRAPRSWSTVG